MATAFEICFALVVASEGGYTVDAADPGGETKFGISKRAYPTLNIASLTLADAEAIYRRDYWDKIHGDDLPPPLALLTFDAAVNSGVATASVWLQQAVGADPDGIVGLATVKAADAAPEVPAAVELMARRAMHLASLSSWGTFGLGWSRRMFKVFGQAVAAGLS